MTFGLNTADPLGVAAQARARQRRFSDTVAADSMAPGEDPGMVALRRAATATGPLPDQQWDAFFESAGAGGNKPVRFGYASDPSSETANTTSTPTTSTSGASMTSTQLGTPVPLGRGHGAAASAQSPYDGSQQQRDLYDLLDKIGKAHPPTPAGAPAAAGAAGGTRPFNGYAPSLAALAAAARR